MCASGECKFHVQSMFPCYNYCWRRSGKITYVTIELYGNFFVERAWPIHSRELSFERKLVRARKNCPNFCQQADARNSHKKDASSFEDESTITTIAGSKETFSQITELCESWIEQMKPWVIEFIWIESKLSTVLVVFTLLFCSSTIF